jgi:hypothetical protein
MGSRGAPESVALGYPPRYARRRPLSPNVSLEIELVSLVQMRRNLRGTIKTSEQALLAIDAILEALRPKCKSCLFEHGLVA